MNKVILTGGLTQEPQIRFTTTNKKVVSVGIAVKKDFKNQDGDYESNFFNLKIWNNNAEYISKYGKKGSKVVIEGKLDNNAVIDNDNNKKTYTEVIVEHIEILSNFKDKGSKEQTTQQQQEEYNDPFAEYGKQVTIDDSFLD